MEIASDMSQVVIRVNGRPVTEVELKNAVQGLSMDLYRKTMDQLPADELARLEEIARERLVGRELIYQEALGQGVVATEDAVAEEVDKARKNFPSDAEFFATLEKAGIDPAGYMRMIRQDLTVNLMTEKHLGDIPSPTDTEIESVYKEHLSKMKKPGRVRASHILVRAGEGERDEALIKIGKIREGLDASNFARLAEEHSNCPSASRGGDLGFFQKGNMVKPFEEAAFSLKKGEISDVVETQFGFHLILVTGREEEEPLQLEAATPKIREFLIQEKKSAALEQWVKTLREKAVVEEGA